MNNLSVIEYSDAERAEQEAVSLKERVDALLVVDQVSYDAANAINADAYSKRKAFHAFFDPIDDASKKQRQTVIAQGKKVDEPLDYVIKVTGQKASAWIREQEAIAAENKRKAEAIARKEAEEAAIRTAEALAASGMQEAAEAVFEAPIVVPRVAVEQPAKADGVYYTDRYSAEVVSLMELVKAVAEGKAPIYYLEANVVTLNSWARNSKGVEALPGVKVVKTTTQGRR